MTGEDKALQERILDDERAVQELLEGADRTDDPVLWDLLLQVRELRTVDIPAPSPRLRALLAEPEAAGAIRVAPATPLKKTQMVFTMLAVAASFGIASAR